MTDSKVMNPQERSVSPDEAVARFRAFKPQSEDVACALHDALGLPLTVGDEVVWSSWMTGSQHIEFRRGQVISCSPDKVLVFAWHSDRRQWLFCDRVIVVTRLLKGEP